MSTDNSDRDGFPARIPEYVFKTAAIVTANPDVKARLPWFRRAVESAFMNGYEAGRKSGVTYDQAANVDPGRTDTSSTEGREYRMGGYREVSDVQ